MEAEERGWIRRRMEEERERGREEGRRYMRLVTSIFNEASTTVACRTDAIICSFAPLIYRLIVPYAISLLAITR